MKRAALLLLMVTGCAAAAPASIQYGQSASAPAAPPRDTRAPQRARSDDSPVSAAQWEGEGTPLSTYALRPEDVHPYDLAHLPRTHRVGANETLSDVATMYQVPVLALIQENGLQPPYALSRGQDLRLPQPRFHTVVRNETFEDIARRYAVDTRSLALLNRMQRPYAVRPGDRIVLPVGVGGVEASPSPPPSTEALAPAGPARFAMPMRGEITARFGARESGGRIDGIEIAGREGEPVMAAADGDVVYAGEDVPGYGSLVLIRHADNYVTAYGYNRRALVREGQRVRAGQRIAELGLRSDGRGLLLFQVRQGSTAVDPAPLLGLSP
ncbi:MAG: M23 family metallopeptidase [Hyphomonadaceae bacterium]|nr:M23 family metallopeptidase [Hyphomonadaceae bacterium]